MKTGHPMDQARLAVAAKFTPMMVLDFVVKKGKKLFKNSYFQF